MLVGFRLQYACRGVFDWLCCIWHDLFGHPVTIGTGIQRLHYNAGCRGCRGRKRAFCDICWHHYTLSY